MRRFLLHAVASMAALAVLAPLGVGARAQAGLLYHAGLRPDPGMVADEFELSLPDDFPPSSPEPAPVAKDASHRLPLALPSPCCDTGGACSPSATGDLASSSSCQAGLLPGAEPKPRPPLITFLPIPHGDPLPDPAVASIFHPPRRAPRG
jgi:hypothetical protein